ncbi:MAG: histidinol-phosphate transaminase [Geminicoccaceae bacterium]|nr:histidinol-phosphate transaminase [Geminicoccaceae bacterium]
MRPTPRPGILEIAPYVGGRAEVGSGRPAIKLSSNESAIGPSKEATAACNEAASALHRYPDGGSERLRAAIARRFNLDAARVVCGAGSDELIALLIKAYAGPGDEVLYSRHGFLMYRLSALAAGAHPVDAPERDLTTDVDALLARVTSRTKLVFVANPNNPTGSYLPAAELARLHAGLPAHVLLVVDAAYAEYVDVPDYSDGTDLALRHPNVVMTRTFSKLFGLAALRLGWMLGSPEVVEVINRVRSPFNVSAPAQAAGVAALADVAHQERAKAHNDRWLPWLKGRIEGLGLTVHPSVGNFLLVAFPKDAGRDAAAASTFLEARGIIPREMGGYGLGHCLRISVGTKEENEALMAALEDFRAKAS